MSINSKLYHKMLEVANKASKIPGVKALFKPIYYPIKRLFEKSQRRKFLKNGTIVLQRFDKCCNENDIRYTLAFGTLLGAVREKGFIKHDLDIDVYVWGEQYSPKIVSALQRGGFNLIHSFCVEDGSIGREETYECDGVAIDVFYLFTDDGKYPYCCDFTTINKCPTFNESMKKYGAIKARRIELPIDRERMRVPFENIELYIPKNAHEILRFRYGDDYMIPNPSWGINSHNTHIREWTDKKAYYHEA